MKEKLKEYGQKQRRRQDKEKRELEEWQRK